MGITGVTSDKFEFQSTITSVHFGSNCTFIEHEAFNTCELLETINDDNVIENIGDGAFHKTNISSATFNNLKNISSGGLTSTNKYGAFQDCAKLSYISIPKCESIGNNAFNNCISLNEIDLSNATYIGNYAFNSCSNLKSVKINKPSIHNFAFANCSNLSNIYLDNCSEIGEGAFLNCTSLNTINLNECKKIGSSAFYNCTSITQLTLSKCEEIYPFAFANCHSLNKVYINTEYATCQLMGDYVFCTHSGSTCLRNENIVFLFKAQTLDIYKNMPYWSHYSNNMAKIVEPNQIIYITNNNKSIVFNDELNVDSDSDSDSYDNIYGENSNFGVINFYVKEITHLEKEMFKNQDTLTSIDIPSNCKVIEQNAFEGCTNLQSIKLSETLKEIQDFAFKGCKSLTQIEIPNTIENLGEGIFAGCESLKKIDGNTNFITYNGRAIVSGGQADSDSDSQSGSTLIFVLPNDDSDTEGRIHKISEIDENITRLGESCFSGCKKLRRVDIPSNVIEIGDNAFEGCKNLREIHFSSENPPTLGTNSFGKIEDIRDDFKIFVPEESLETYIKNWGDYIEYIYPIPTEKDSVIFYTIDNNNLSLNTNPTKVEIGEKIYFKIKVNSIPIDFFNGKTNITKVILGENVTTIPDRAFKGCAGLDYIYLSDKITTIGSNCFLGCSNLKSVHIPKLSKSVFGNDIFDSALEEFGTYYKGYVSDDNRCYIDRDTDTLMFFAKGNLSSTYYTIPDNITTINNFAFSNSDITSITLKPSVKSIGQYAFSECSKLTSINNWNDVEIIGHGAFSGCGELDKISLPSNLVMIGSGAFSGCKKMYIDTNIPNSVTTIGASAFYNCEKFRCVDNGREVPLNLGKITIINSNVFCNNKSLEKVKIHNTITSIGLSAFDGCENLKEVIIDARISKLTTIGSRAFNECKNLYEFNLPVNLKTISSYAFYKCVSYKGGASCILINNSIANQTENIYVQQTIPFNVTTMGTACFKGSGIESLNILDYSKLTTIPDSAFEDCTNLIDINISTSRALTTIKNKAFYNCTNITRCIFPINITTIEDSAFEKCGINSVTLPPKLKYMGTKCFHVNSNIVVHIPVDLEYLPAFTKSGSTSILSAPFSTDRTTINIHNTFISAIEQNAYWGQYINIIKIENSTTININLKNAYIDKDRLNNKYPIANTLRGGIIDTNRSIYLYNSVWETMKMPYFINKLSANSYTISFSIIDCKEMSDFINYDTYATSIPDTLYISIPMLYNSAKYRIIVTLLDYNSWIGGTSHSVPIESVMLSMNTSLYNGEDWDNRTRFYYMERSAQPPTNLDPNICLIGGIYPIKSNLKIPFDKVFDICPSIMCVTYHNPLNIKTFSFRTKISSIKWYDSGIRYIMFDSQKIYLLDYFISKSPQPIPNIFTTLYSAYGLSEFSINRKS